MKVESILNGFLTDVTPDMHKVRRASLNALVTSLVSGAGLSVTSLGRNIDSKTTEKHQIKRSTRLLSNHHLHGELNGIYSKLCLHLIGSQKHPVILVDWSDLDPRKQHFLLRAAVAVDGRSLTLIEEIHPLSRKEKPEVHRQFMGRLKKLLPDSCSPIIVTDAGFRVPWFSLIQSLGWDYVGRVRNKTFCKNELDEDWHPVKDLYQQASATARSLGGYQMCRRNPIDCQMVVYKRKKKGRKDLTATGESARKCKHSRSNAAREKEPWLLATSLSPSTSKFAKKITKIYQSRMQIEESFRDLKTGLDFNISNTRKQKRLDVLLLIAILAQFVLYLLGVAVKLRGLHRRYQANTVKDKNVLSYQFLGLRAIKDRYLKLGKRDFKEAACRIQQLILEQSSV